jgi:hypothetical protein
MNEKNEASERGTAAGPLPKRRLTDLAEDYGLPWNKLGELVFKHCDESMVTGTGKSTWLNDAGQRVLESIVPVPTRLRGRVLKPAPNPRYVFAYIAEQQRKVAVQLPRNLNPARMVGKIILIESVTEGETTKYCYVRPTMGG